MSVELIYDPDCPNVAEARANLIRALAASGRALSWREWNRVAPDSPARVRRYGSPTVLVDGHDVAGETPGSDEACCRLYRGGEQSLAGAPSIAQVTGALRRSANPDSLGAASALRGWKGSLLSAPGIALAFLPKLACPACWPALSGVFASLGLGFLLDAAYLLPLTATFLALALAALAYRARRRRGYGPFAVGLAAAAVVMIGKFLFESDWALYGGVSLLIAASLWNAWPRRDGLAACRANPADVPSVSAQQEEVVS
jgi:hypothetical protein